MNWANYRWAHPVKDGSRTLVYEVYLNSIYFGLVWITVLVDWLREEASINDLKRLAIAEAQVRA